MLTKELIVLDSNAKTKLEVIESLAKLALQNNKVSDADAFVKRF
jgi:mannitol/fructose-specific phosphotransferase system IIA component (Ntr-type)